jgi:hypothetical protein
LTPRTEKNQKPEPGERIANQTKTTWPSSSLRTQLR